MTLYEKKILQIHTANFTNSEIISQVPAVSLKVELTVYVLVSGMQKRWILVLLPLLPLPPKHSYFISSYPTHLFESSWISRPLPLPKPRHTRSARATSGHVIRELCIGNQAPSYTKKTWNLEAGPHICPRNHPGKERAWFCWKSDFFHHDPWKGPMPDQYLLG